MPAISDIPNTTKAEILDALGEVLNCEVLERRAAKRLPYFGPVTIRRPFDEQTRLSAFARDLSTDGIGLVHVMPLETGRFVVEMDLPSGRKVDLFVDLLWCRDFGNGWYASGGRFLGVP